ncbi:hypothetical protein [Macromonas bipunctata]|uniref:hypothetical protein n=1 Tax=Macromonas bipunctata TaxID=183670 RepID=UPI00147638B3|nr:hypothetical protein [Macromonas bipunctata]
MPNLTKFAAGLNVTQHVTQADLVALDGFAGAAPVLAGHNIDTLSVEGGAANLNLDDVSALLEAGLNFAASDNISFVDVDVTGTALADHGITLDDLANLGIDSVDVHVGQMDTIGIDAKDGLTADNLAEELTKLVEKFQGQVFAAQDEVTLHVGDNAVAGLSDALLNEIELLGIDFLSGNDLGGSLDLTKV